MHEWDCVNSVILENALGLAVLYAQRAVGHSRTDNSQQGLLLLLAGIANALRTAAAADLYADHIDHCICPNSKCKQQYCTSSITKKRSAAVSVTP
eukprot:19860-Heterococcus_DN1.PRE.4